MGRPDVHFCSRALPTISRVTPMSRTQRLLALALLVAACDGTAPSGGPLTLVSGGNYVYTAYGTLGAPLLTGTMHLEYGVLPAFSTPPQGLAGSWEIHWVPGADQTTMVGPQVGSGEITGLTDSSGVKLSFLPNRVDNDVALAGLVSGASVNGTWTYTTLVGPTQHGRFTLVPMR